MTSQASLTKLKENLRSHLQQLSHPRDPFLATAHYQLARQYVQQQLSQWGKVEAQRFTVRRQLHVNWLLPLSPAAQKPVALPILAGAHYDTVVGSPGADDNASGVAVLLELARLWSEQPGRSPLILVAFDLEEYGLAGSRFCVEQLQKANQRLRLMLSLEMLGYYDDRPGSQHYPPGLKYFFPQSGNFVGLIGNWRSLPHLIHLSKHLSQAGMPAPWLPAGQRGKLVPDTRRSDHAPFWDAGYRAILVTDTANLRNPHYHQPSDRLETLDLDRLTQVCWGLFQGIRLL
ncbi:M28 family peptidase [Almyronema epifaneia]|uniref:M28 family peptidase n=1 Tax=Almyronema epifaneia S1 TaxID=2991925 RepID=A0ABW6IKH4_9CYAN